MAAQVRWGKPITEIAVLYWKEKKVKGTYRPIFNLGPVRRTACEAIRPLIAARHHPKPFQFDYGIHHAVRKMVRAIEEGYVYFSKLDISNYARSWAGVFQECPSAAQDLELARKLVDGYLPRLGVTFDELNGYVNPDAEWDGDYDG